jgi:hypothetical protein
MLLNYAVTVALIVLCVLLGAWYFLMAWLNRRRGIGLARLLHERLIALKAEGLTGRWVNASIFQIAARQAGPPIGRLTALLVLEARELPLIWLVNLLRGRRDLLVMRIDLRSAPARGVELEAHPWRAKPEREVRQRIEVGDWQQLAVSDYRLYFRPEAAHLQDVLAALLPEWQPYLRRLSISATSPHLLLSFSPAAPVLASMSRLSDVQRLAEAVLKRQSTGGGKR